ncbi:MAG: CxxxxCH/CxxCH domain-containing protein [Deltaproteobacteria bacterium]|nr:CxxxxCH/CxxCH domain-containing protein [Deltaproteobacteria bacterium]
MSAPVSGIAVAAAAASALLVAACDRAPLASGLPAAAQTSCSACHGSVDNAAPPAAADGESASSVLAVGAHQQHLRAGNLRNPIACGECHLVPTLVDAPGHLDPAPAEVRFGELARHGDAAPSWNRERAACRNVYCHGASLAGGQQTEPVWTQVDGSQRACSACHGFPPPPPHPPLAGCKYCHPATLLDDGRIDLAAALHVDGKVDVTSGCTRCHGSSEGPAPPVDLQGNSETSAIGVGAHQSHLRAGQYRQAIACGECHLVPAALVARGHVDGLGPAEVRFGTDALARADGATPTWQREGSTPNCSDVYCHGATLGGGLITEPVWTRVDGSQVGCGTCHGLPPPPPHPDDGDCAQCHSRTVSSDGTIDVAGGAHIDGTVTQF